MWVRSEYAGELAVLSAWVSMLLPWNVVWKGIEHAEFPVDSSVVFLRFALLELQIRGAGTIRANATAIGEGVQRIDASALLAQQYPGTEVFADFFVATPPGSALFYSSPHLFRASLAWTFGAVAFLSAFVLSLALYFREEQVREHIPVSEVRLMGGLLGLGVLGTAVATGLYYVGRDVAGTPIPVGVLVIAALAVVLLQTERA